MTENLDSVVITFDFNTLLMIVGCISWIRARIRKIPSKRSQKGEEGIDEGKDVYIKIGKQRKRETLRVKVLPIPNHWLVKNNPNL